jgi:diguanylate cyclase (GGDEF)-like protein
VIALTLMGIALERNLPTWSMLTTAELLGMGTAMIWLELRGLRQALCDPLTGPLNHRARQSALHDALLSNGARLPVLLLLLDIDHLRRFDEAYDHAKGEGALRPSDSAARDGGEEFAVVSPNTDEVRAPRLAQTIRAAHAARMIPTATGSATLTVSVGHTTFPQLAAAPASLLQADELALYAAGRAAVIAYTAHLLDAHTQYLPDPLALAQGEASEITLPAVADLETAQAFITAVDPRDGYTAAHSDSALRKPEEVEWRCMQAHTVMGEENSRPVEKLRHLPPRVRWPHDPLDGSGYSDGLKGDQIPMPVRILSVVDVFRAVPAERPYHPGRPA